MWINDGSDTTDGALSQSALETIRESDLGVPEPASLSLIGMAATAMMLRRRRRRAAPAPSAPASGRL
jgi:hypothetical protein